MTFLIQLEIAARRRKIRKKYIIGFVNFLGDTEKKFSSNLFANSLKLQNTSLW